MRKTFNIIRTYVINNSVTNTPAQLMMQHGVLCIFIQVAPPTQSINHPSNPYTLQCVRRSYRRPYIQECLFLLLPPENGRSEWIDFICAFCRVTLKKLSLPTACRHLIPSPPSPQRLVALCFQLLCCQSLTPPPAGKALG